MNIRIKRDNDRALNITVTKDDVVQDITGWTVYFAVKRRVNDTDENAIIFKEVTVHTDAVNGETAISIDAADTADKKVGSYYFDIKIVDDQGKKQSSETGVFDIVQEIADGGA